MKHTRSTIFILTVIAALTFFAVGDVMARGGYCGGYGINQQNTGSDTSQQASSPTGNNSPGWQRGKGGIRGGPGSGFCRGAGINILDGEPVTITGTVSQAGVGPGGVSVDTGTEVVAIYGLGACRYTNELDITPIDVGDTITIKGYQVSFGDNDTRIIAMSIVKDGVEVQLRDPDTGAPLWRPSGKGFSGRGLQAHSSVNILEGTPTTISGKVAKAGFGPSIDVDNGTEKITVYGIGPYPYWDSLGIARPAAGDQITIEGYQVTFSDDSVRTIAMKAIVNGVEVQLRDPETGQPMWRRGPKTE